MRILVAAVGRFGGGRPGPERALFEHYARRIASPLELREVEAKGAGPPAGRMKREGELLLRAVPRGAVVVALDRGGRAVDSVDFATRIGRWRDGGVKDLVFLIGGADGLDPSVLARADLVLSLGAMTWPHLLVRGLLAEQIYRAECLLAGHPYHRAARRR